MAHEPSKFKFYCKKIPSSCILIQFECITELPQGFKIGSNSYCKNKPVKFKETFIHIQDLLSKIAYEKLKVSKE